MTIVCAWISPAPVRHLFPPSGDGGLRESLTTLLQPLSLGQIAGTVRSSGFLSCGERAGYDDVEQHGLVAAVAVYPITVAMTDRDIRPVCRVMKISFQRRDTRRLLFNVSVLVREPVGVGHAARTDRIGRVGLTGDVETRLAKNQARYGTKESQPLAKKEIVAGICRH